ncbi:MAG: hypothetical protein WD342_11690 [Verrucomicrobiales bacterium]
MKREIFFLPGFFAVLLTLSLSNLGAADRARVLYLGDSLSMGAFGRTFDQSLRSSGFAVHTVVAGGASPYYWLKNYQSLPCTIGFWEKTPHSERRVGYVPAVPKLEDLVESHEPDVVVVQTGINLYATLRSKRRPKTDNVAEVTSLIEQMCYSIAKGGAISYWVLPPHSHEKRYPEALQEELGSIMRSVARKFDGEVFESREVTHFDDPYPATDGVHYGPTEARSWAEKVSGHFRRFMEADYAPETPRMVRAEPVRAEPTKTEGEPDALPVESSQRSFRDQEEEVDLLIKLVAKSEIKHISELEYANALGVYEYEVVKDRLGNYPFDRIRVAHGIVFGRKYTGTAHHEIGSEMSLRMVPLAKYKSLLTWQTVDDLRPNFELPLYTPKLD